MRFVGCRCRRGKERRGEDWRVVCVGEEGGGLQMLAFLHAFLFGLVEGERGWEGGKWDGRGGDG